MKEFIDKETVTKLKQLDALTYFKNYRPEEIKKNSRNDYILKEHDSLHFSNGKWYWWSQRKGGKNAIDFLMIVEGYNFIDACKILLAATQQSMPVRYVQKEYKTNFRLPEPDINNDLVIKYLSEERMIDKNIINFFVDNKQIYQDKTYKNVVFVGYDNGVAKYAFKRSITQNFKGEAMGSNKAHSFSYTNKESKSLRVFESAIDMLSYMTIQKINGFDFRNDNFLSIAGASKQIKAKKEADLPIALKTFLSKNKQIDTIYFHLDNDDVGIGSTRKMIEILCRDYYCFDFKPTDFKDVNEELKFKLKEKNNE